MRVKETFNSIEYAELGCLYDFLRKNSIEYFQILLWAKQIALGKYLSVHCV